jgi:hypothetical protein
LHDFPRRAQQSIALRKRPRFELTAPAPGEVALEPGQSETAGAGTGKWGWNRQTNRPGVKKM